MEISRRGREEKPFESNRNRINQCLDRKIYVRKPKSSIIDGTICAAVPI